MIYTDQFELWYKSIDLTFDGLITKEDKKYHLFPYGIKNINVSPIKDMKERIKIIDDIIYKCLDL